MAGLIARSIRRVTRRLDVLAAEIEARGDPMCRTCGYPQSSPRHGSPVACPSYPEPDHELRDHHAFRRA